MKNIIVQLRTGFTLIEMLVVIAIIAALAVIILPTIGWGSQKAEELRTEGVLQITDKALSSYEKLHRGIAVPTWLNTDPVDQPVNKLFWRLNHELTDTELDEIKTESIAAQTAASDAVNLTDADVYQGAHTASSWPSHQASYFAAMKKEFGILAKRNKIRELSSDVVLDKADIGSDFIQTYTVNGKTYENIVDAWGTPLIYVGKFDAGIPYKAYDSYHKKADPFGQKNAQRNVIIDANKDGSLEDDIAQSDMRTDSFKGFQLTFELWSAGLDMQCNAIRGEDVNIDNLSPRDFR